MQNLWEEHQHIEAAPAPLKRAKRRVPTDAATLAALRGWLLRDYLVPYCRLLAATRIFRRCIWIDGLGEARNIAPVLQDVAAVAQELAGESKPMALRALALQPGGNQREETPFVLPKQSGILNGDWPSLAPDLLAALDQAAALFLLNPLAPASSPSLTLTKQGRFPFFTHTDIAPLYTRNAPTELCLLFSHAQIEQRLLPALQRPEVAGAFTALLRSDRWKSLQGQNQAAEGITGLFQAAIQAHFLATQRFAFPVCIGPATIEDAPYTLLFATRRQDSLVCMNDALYAYRRRLEEESYRGLLNEEWFSARQRARLAGEMESLLERVLRAGRARSPRRWPVLRQQLLLDQFGSYLLSDYDLCINKLLEAGEVRCEWRQRHSESSGETQRIPGNDDVLYWTSRQQARGRMK